MDSFMVLHGKTFVKSALVYSSMVRPDSVPMPDGALPHKPDIDAIRKITSFIASTSDEDVDAALALARDATYGSCFRRSVLMCALLRASGLGDEEVFVVIGCHHGEPLLEATHASVMIRTDQAACIANPSSVVPFCQVWVGRDKVESYFRETAIACMFNDMACWLCTGASDND